MLTGSSRSRWWGMVGQTLTSGILAFVLEPQRRKGKLREHLWAGGKQLRPGERAERAAWSAVMATEWLTSLSLCHPDYQRGALQ